MRTPSRLSPVREPALYAGVAVAALQAVIAARGERWTPRRRVLMTAGVVLASAGVVRQLVTPHLAVEDEHDANLELPGSYQPPPMLPAVAE